MRRVRARKTAAGDARKGCKTQYLVLKRYFYNHSRRARRSPALPGQSDSQPAVQYTCVQPVRESAVSHPVPGLHLDLPEALEPGKGSVHQIPVFEAHAVQLSSSIASFPYLTLYFDFSTKYAKPHYKSFISSQFFIFVF